MKIIIKIIFKIRSKVLSWIASLRYYQTVRDYCQLNRKVLATPSHSLKGPIILMELNDMHSAHIAYAYLGSLLAEKHGAEIKAYFNGVLGNWWLHIKFKLNSSFYFGKFGIYKSFGANEFIYIQVDKLQCIRASEMHVEIINRLNNNRDIEDLHINGVWVGDLIYDSFLREYNLPTIDPSSLIFRNFLLKSIELFVFWEDYLNNNDVRAINVSHCVYNLAIPLRLAIKMGIEVYQANLTHIYHLSGDKLFAYSSDFFEFREKFASLPLEIQKAGVSLAEERMNCRFAGDVGVDMIYSTKSAFTEPTPERLLRQSERTKILIATHCFFDSPHSFGKNLFPDFYQWMEFLGDISEQTDYDWYIKTHPDYVLGTKDIVDNLVARFPKFTLLPSDSSHKQIVAEGIDVALTCYGTIGFEYAALGVMVINASMNNQHIAYDFNLHARDVIHYRELLFNLPNLELIIDKKQVYEYYFMRYIYNTDNIFFKDYNKIVWQLGGYYKQFTPEIYKYWINEWSEIRHIEVVRAINKFISSGDFRMDLSHYGLKTPISLQGTKT